MLNWPDTTLLRGKIDKNVQCHCVKCGLSSTAMLQQPLPIVTTFLNGLLEVLFLPLSYSLCLCLVFPSLPSSLSLSLVLSSCCSLTVFRHNRPAARSPWILPLAAHLFVFGRNVNDSDSGCRVWRLNFASARQSCDGLSLWVSFWLPSQSAQRGWDPGWAAVWDPGHKLFLLSAHFLFALSICQFLGN